MRFQLQTVLLLIVAVAIGLGWWVDHARQRSRLELNETQIRQLQRQVEEQAFTGFISQGTRFKTPEEVVAFVQTATHDESEREDWGAVGRSHMGAQAVGPLVELLKSDKEDVRRRAVMLLGFIGYNKRLGPVDPIPALIAAVEDPSRSVRIDSMFALSNFGPPAQSALPVLRKISERDLSQEAWIATKSIKEIAPSEDIGPRMRELFVKGEKGIWSNVAFYLPDHLPAAEAKKLLLAKSEKETDAASREVLAQALNKIKE